MVVLVVVVLELRASWMYYHLLTHVVVGGVGGGTGGRCFRSQSSTLAAHLSPPIVCASTSATRVFFLYPRVLFGTAGACFALQAGAT